MSNDISNQNINNAGAELAGGAEVKPFVPDELWDERMRMMSAMPIEAVDAWTKAAKQVIELKVQLAARDALIARLVEAGEMLSEMVGEGDAGVRLVSEYEDALFAWNKVSNEYQAMKGGER